MPRLIWSASALRDVERAYRFLAERDRDAAKRAVKAIRAGVRLLGATPKLAGPLERGQSTLASAAKSTYSQPGCYY